MLTNPRTYRAKLFRTGGSQAVRLPKECRLPGTEVSVRRVGDAVVLEPFRGGWSDEFVRFVLSSAHELIRREQPKKHERERIDL